MSDKYAMKNFYFLNLDILLFKDGITVGDIPKNPITVLDQEKYLNEEILKFFDFLNLKLSLVETFFKTVGDGAIIHIDSIGGDYTKLNWVFGDADSKMVWYKPINKFQKTISKTTADTPYISYDVNEVTEIERTVVKNPTLVQVGIPHNIINVTENRMCVSIVFRDKDTNKRLTMNESLNRFNDYIIGTL
jgi:hypothetical protein